jgi:hypothetical protein
MLAFHLAFVATLLTQLVVPLPAPRAGQWLEKVQGDMDTPGAPFVARIHADAGYIIFPHTHEVDENVVVLQGVWALGMGLLLTYLLRPGRPTQSTPADCFPWKMGAHVRGEAGEGTVIGARCSPANHLTQYWVRKSSGEQFWAPTQELQAP